MKVARFDRGAARKLTKFTVSALFRYRLRRCPGRHRLHRQIDRRQVGQPLHNRLPLAQRLRLGVLANRRRQRRVRHALLDSQRHAGRPRRVVASRHFHDGIARPRHLRHPVRRRGMIRHCLCRIARLHGAIEHVHQQPRRARPVARHALAIALDDLGLAVNGALQRRVLDALPALRQRRIPGGAKFRRRRMPPQLIRRRLAHPHPRRCDADPAGIGQRRDEIALALRGPAVMAGAKWGEGRIHVGVVTYMDMCRTGEKRFASAVIPAQAGIHRPSSPAKKPSRAMDPRLRGDDGQA